MAYADPDDSQRRALRQRANVRTYNGLRLALNLPVLFATGIGMPLNHYLFHGAFRELHAVAWAAVGLKLACIFAMMVVMGQIFFGLNPRLREMFATFEPGKAPPPEREKEFFQTRAKRKALCETCLKFAVGVLVFSAFIGFRV